MADVVLAQAESVMAVSERSPDGSNADAALDPVNVAPVKELPLPIPLQNPRKDGYIGSVTHVDLGDVYNQLPTTSPRVMEKILDVLRDAYVSYG